MSIHWKELVTLYSHEIGDILITAQEEIQLTVLCKKQNVITRMVKERDKGSSFRAETLLHFLLKAHYHFTGVTTA